MIDPFPRRGIALLRLLHPLRECLLKYLVVVVLRAPDIHIERQITGKPCRSLESLYQIEVRVVRDKLFGQSLDRPPEGETQGRTIQRNALILRLIEQGRDSNEIDG